MTRTGLTILQVSTSEQRGGAEQVARALFHSYRALGHQSFLAVGRGPAADPDVITLSGRRRVAHHAAGAGRLLDRWRGLESYRYPASRHLHAVLPHDPDVVHAHNLHGGYFDLRELAPLSHRQPLVLTLHDAWLLSGHCAHSLDCERWRTGCGHCPDLTIYPAIRRDATALNWQRKRDVVRAAHLNVATPSVWLMERLQASLLGPAVRAARVIPNGVDLTRFAPGDASAARLRLRLPPDRPVLLTVGTDLRTNTFKDWAVVRGAAGVAAERLAQDLLLVALGERGQTERSGRCEIRFVPFVDDAGLMVEYYRAADLYMHGARADTFPGAVVEALACGTPVVATPVGGIPEQVKSLGEAAAEDATGVLVPGGDHEQMGQAVARLLGEPERRQRMARSARVDAQHRFDFNRQRDAYLSWYEELIEERRARSSSIVAPGVQSVSS